MAEYIERNYIRKMAMLEMAYTMETETDAAVVLRMIDDAPAADVAPVVHGRWVDGKCSNCGVDIPTDDAHDAIFENECRFCYYCGAKMDGEKKDGGNNDALN